MGWRIKEIILKLILLELTIIIRISSYTILENSNTGPPNLDTLNIKSLVNPRTTSTQSAVLKSIITTDSGSVNDVDSNISVPCTSGKDKQNYSENCLSQSLLNRYQKKCPSLYPNILVGSLPNGEATFTNSSYGKYVELSGVHTLEECIGKCCFSEICNFATLYKNTCYLFYCSKDPNSCIPKQIPSPRESPNSHLNPNLLKTILVHQPYGYIRANSSCEYGITTQCFVNEVCISKNSRSRNGHCQCVENYLLNYVGQCIGIPDAKMLNEMNIDIDEPSLSTSTTPSPIKVLEVSVSSKNITLPEHEVTLYAYAVPEASPESPYSFEWNLISHPSQDPATMEGQTTAVLHLSGVIQGSYTFQVTVRGKNALGSANATVTVYPQKRTNQPPIAVITPANQTIQLPTNSAILDGTSSTDDDKIVSYKWEVQKGPIDFKFPSVNGGGSTNSSTLQIKDLVPGNYTFKLTVEDGDHATNSTTADINVLKEIDYPPTANAGTDIVIYLPQTEVTLNGNASTDDKKIVQWEWKASGDEKKAVDMQDSHTAYLKLSGLEEGMYVFELTVTDEAGQSSKSVVHVFVKQPSGNPPKANAGEDATITLPLSWVLLDSSQSKADGKIVKWKWTQVSGPNNSTILKTDEIQANATGLTKGEYIFQVDIEDDAKLKSSSQVKVTVTQKTNEPPKAIAGDDTTVILPLTLVQLNGTKSSDDVKITEWKWDREKESSAAGNIVGNSDSSPNLQIINLVPGKYVFKLTVKDEQGLSDEDSVVLTVLEDPLISNEIEIILDLKINELSESNKEKFLQQLSLLVQDTKLIIHHISTQEHSGLAVIVLYGTNVKGDIKNGVNLSNELASRLRQDKALLAFTVLSIDTVLCLDPCSGHGVCHDFVNSRQCICDPFWMENYFKKRFGSGQRNCEWSKIYVGVVACLLVLMTAALLWSFVILFQRRHFGSRRGTHNGKLTNGFLKGGGSSRKHNGNNGSTSQNHKKQYTLLDDDEGDIEMEIKAADEPDTDESDSGESLIFQRKGPDSSSRVKLLPNTSTNPSTSIPNTSASINGNGKKLNGILKKGRPGGIKA